MKILAVEFSSEQRSVALIEGNAVQSRLCGIAEEKGGRSTRAFALIEDVLHQAQMEREEIECIAVGLGPGSYTGIRAAIALAQGWQLGRDVKLLGISSVECLAAQARAMGIHGHVNIIVDAQRNEFYLAKWEISQSAFLETESLRIVSFAEVEERIAGQQITIGPEATRYFKGSQDLFAGAAVLGRLALLKFDFVSGEKLEPIYLRETSFVKAPPPRLI